MVCDKYSGQIKELICNVIHMTETLELINNALITEDKKKVNSLISVLAVYGKDLDKKARLLQLNILRDEAENSSQEKIFKE